MQEREISELMGDNGISDEFGVARRLVNLKVVDIYEGMHDIHALFLGRRDHWYRGVCQLKKGSTA